MVLVFVSLISLPACNLLETVYEDEIKEVKDAAKDVKSAVKTKPVAKPPKEEVKKEYKRPDLLVRRDPFIFEPPADKLTPEAEERDIEPLEAYSIKSLRLVALVTGTAVPKAMFQVAGGNGIFAKEGDRIGRDGGRITEIRANEVEITVAGAPERAPEPGEDPKKVAEESEPTTIIIRLSDTDLILEEETTEEEQNLLDSIDNPGDRPNARGARAPQAPTPVPAPASPEKGEDAP